MQLAALVLIALALSSVSCASGFGDGSGAVAGSEAAAGCGNGIADPGEQCEVGQPMPTCNDLGMGSGEIVCTSDCRLIMMCGNPSGGSGGSGGTQ